MTIRETAVVQRVVEDKAIVKVKRSEACSGCTAKGMCHALGSQTSEMEVEVLNERRARPGDVVEISVPSHSLLKSTMVVYVVPVCALIGGLFAGLKIASIIGVENPSLLGFICAMVSMLGAFLFVRWFDRKASKNTDYMPRITNVLEGYSLDKEHYEL